MTLTTYKINDQYKGDTFNGVTFTLKEGADKTPINLTGATILSQFRTKGVTGAIQQTLEIGSGITVTDATGGVFRIDSFVLDWNTGTFYYDIQITFTDGSVRTYVKGTLNVIQDVTNV
tara:strand:+ start:272 stop:625 length:354 start_codon:yes stop_codon:yes gene_type:complete